MMTPLQRYLFDTTGYLHIKNPLTSDELANAQDAVCRYIDASADKIPFGPGDFLPFLVFDKALENPALHPSIWPIITELTGGKPRMLPSSHLKITTHKDAPLINFIMFPKSFPMRLPYSPSRLLVRCTAFSNRIWMKEMKS